MFPFVIYQKLNVKIGQLKTLALRLTKEEELIQICRFGGWSGSNITICDTIQIWPI